MRKLFALASLLVIASMVLSACGGGSAPIQATSTPNLWDRPQIIVPPNYKYGTMFVGYLDSGWWYNDGQIFVFIKTVTGSRAIVTICYIEIVKQSGMASGCSDQVLSLDYNDIQHSFLDGINFQHPIWLFTDGKNITVWNKSGVNYISPKPGDIAKAIGIMATPSPEAINEDVTPVPVMIPGLTYYEMIDRRIYQVCTPSECAMTKWDKVSNSFTRLKWDNVEYNYTYIPNWMPWSDDLLVYNMLNELQIVEGKSYAVCSNPGNSVWLKGKILEGCIMGMFIGMSNDPDKLYYQFLDPEANIWKFSYFPGAFNLVRPINVH